jgi:hypothetical protein
MDVVGANHALQGTVAGRRSCNRDRSGARLLSLGLQKLKVKWRFFFVVALLVSAFWLALRSTSHSSRDLALGFAGFTNSGGQSHALFWVTNRTSPKFSGWFHHVSWRVHHVILKIGDDWKEDDNPPYPQFLDYLARPAVLHVAVSTTNLPLRVVFECFEQIPIIDKARETYQEHVRNRSVSVANGRHYFVTNEVLPNKALEPTTAPFLRSTGAGIRILVVRPAIASGGGGQAFDR